MKMRLPNTILGSTQAGLRHRLSSSRLSSESVSSRRSRSVHVSLGDADSHRTRNGVAAIAIATRAHGGAAAASSVLLAAALANAADSVGATSEAGAAVDAVSAPVLQSGARRVFRIGVLCAAPALSTVDVAAAAAAAAADEALAARLGLAAPVVGLGALGRAARALAGRLVAAARELAAAIFVTAARFCGFGTILWGLIAGVVWIDAPAPLATAGGAAFEAGAARVGVAALFPDRGAGGRRDIAVVVAVAVRGRFEPEPAPVELAPVAVGPAGDDVEVVLNILLEQELAFRHSGLQVAAIRVSIAGRRPLSDGDVGRLSQAHLAIEDFKHGLTSSVAFHHFEQQAGSSTLDSPRRGVIPKLFAIWIS
jgi:hypothetical protein